MSHGTLRRKHCDKSCEVLLLAPHTYFSEARGKNLNGIKTLNFTLILHLTMSFGWRPGEIPITLYKSKTVKLFSYVAIASKKEKEIVQSQVPRKCIKTIHWLIKVVNFFVIVHLKTHEAFPLFLGKNSV